MNWIKLLHQEEENKNFKRYCEIAEDIILSDDLNFSPVLISQIQARRDLYLNRLIKDRSQKIQVLHILEKLYPESLNILEKCCPSLNEFIHSHAIHNDLMCSNPSVAIQDKILDISITKSKDLRILWDDDYKTDIQDIYCFQVLLEGDFQITPLRPKSHHQATKDSYDDVFELDNEFMPIFIVCANNGLGSVESVYSIPFPSALRGSYHYAELVSCCSEFHGIAAINQFSQNFIQNQESQHIQKIFIASQNYDVGLVYSNEDFRRWISIVHDIKIQKYFPPDAGDNNVLCLPQDSFPTLALVINGFTSSSISESIESSDILIVDDADYQPLYKVSAKTPKSFTEQASEKLAVFPYIANQSIKFHTDTLLSVLQTSNNAPLSLYPPRNPILNFDHNESSNQLNTEGILVIVKVADVSSVTDEFLLSLAHQQNINLSRIVFFTNAKSENKLKMQYKNFAAKWQLNVKATFNCDQDYLHLILRKSSNVLFINPYIILQDPNTLRTLSDNIRKYQSFTSGCMLNHLQSAQKYQLYFNNTAGLYLSLDSYCDTGRVTLEAKNIIKSLPPTDICVLSNHYDLCLFDSKLLLSYQFNHNHLDHLELFLAQVSCQALLNGERNVCSTKVCANYLRSPTLNMSIIVDSKTSRYIVDNISNLTSKVTSFSKLIS